MKQLFISAFFAVIFHSPLFIDNCYAYLLPDSGQTLCYQVVDCAPDSGLTICYGTVDCAGTGQDGAYNINPMSFTDKGDGTVNDNNTGLVWQKCSVGQSNDETCSGTATSFNWYQASGTYNAASNADTQNVCSTVTLGGNSDWRLPSKKELMSIVDYSIPYQGPTIQQSSFPNTVAPLNTVAILYWSSITFVDHPVGAWRVDFSNGGIDYYPKSNSYSVRCVRGGQ